MSQKSLFIVALFIFATVRPALASDPCDAALVTSSYHEHSNSAVDFRLAHLVDQSTYDDIKRKGGATALIEDLPVGLSLQDYNSRAEHYAEKYGISLSESEARNMAWTGLDSQASAIYRDCLTAKLLTQPGLHVAVRDATKQDVSLMINWIAPGGLPQIIAPDWQTTDSAVKAALPKQVENGQRTVVIPRPTRELLIAANWNGFTSGSVIIEPARTTVHLPPSFPAFAGVWKGFWIGTATNTKGVRANVEIIIDLDSDYQIARIREINLDAGSSDDITRFRVDGDTLWYHQKGENTNEVTLRLTGGSLNGYAIGSNGSGIGKNYAIELSTQH